MKNIGTFLTGLLIISCTAQKNIHLTEQSQLKFLGVYTIPHNKIFQNTTVGGLSGIDYDKKKDVYFLVCDDRSAIDPARFYTAKIFLDKKAGHPGGGGIDSVQFVSVTNFLQPNGQVYPNSKQDPFHTPDPEAMRYNARTGQLVWSSEGEKIVRKEGVVLEDPSVKIISMNGKFIDSFILPSNLHMQAIEKGPRQNGVFEGLSFMNRYKKLLVNMEEPLYEDGPRAGLDSAAWIRIIRYDVKTRKPEAQYAYRIDPVAYPANPPGAFKINGVPDILAINDHQLLVLERSFSTGRKSCTIKLFLADMRPATDVSKIPSLRNAAFNPLTKKLLLNMDSLGIYTDNIEGVTLGPRLSNGRQSLVLVADNNFSAEEITQFFLFEIE